MNRGEWKGTPAGFVRENKTIDVVCLSLGFCGPRKCVMQDARCLLHVKSNLRGLVAASLYWSELRWHDLAEPVFPAAIPFYASAADCARVRVSARVVEFELDTAAYSLFDAVLVAELAKS